MHCIPVRVEISGTLNRLDPFFQECLGKGPLNSIAYNKVPQNYSTALMGVDVFKSR